MVNKPNGGRENCLSKTVGAYHGIGCNGKHSAHSDRKDKLEILFGLKIEGFWTGYQWIGSYETIRLLETKERNFLNFGDKKRET